MLFEFSRVYNKILLVPDYVVNWYVLHNPCFPRFLTVLQLLSIIDSDDFGGI